MRPFQGRKRDSDLFLREHEHWCHRVSRMIIIIINRIYPIMLNSVPSMNPSAVAQGLIPSFPNTSQTRIVPMMMLLRTPKMTQSVGTSRSSVSVSLSTFCVSPFSERRIRRCRTRSTIYSTATGSKDIRLSTHMMPRAVHNIHPRAPYVISPIGPGAQPEYFERGERIPQPTNMPYVRISWVNVSYLI